MRDSKLKPSNHNCIGDIPYEWNVKKLKYVVQKLKSGGTPDSSNPDYYSDDDTGIKWLSIGDMSTNDFVYDTKNRITNSGVLVKNLNIFPAGTILYSIYATIGKVSELGTEATINQAILAITPKNEMNKDYLKFNLKSLEDYAVSLTSASTQKNLNANKVENFPIVFPQLKEQELIAFFLNRKCSNIDSIISDLEKQIEIAEKYKKSVIIETVTKGLNPDVEMKESGTQFYGKIPSNYSVRKLKYIFTLSKGLSITKENLEEEGINCINYGQIHSKLNTFKGVSDDLVKFVNPDYVRLYPKCLVRENDFIFADTSEDLEGSGNFVYIDIDDITFAGYHCIIARPINHVNTKYFAYLFQSEGWREQIRSKVYGVKVFSITNSILKNSIVLIPSIIEQFEIVDYLDKMTENIDFIIKDKNNQIETIKKYKNSLIYEYVTGKKRVSQGDVNE